MNQFKENWDNLWNGLYKTKNKERFVVKTDGEITELAKQLYANGGEDNDQVKYKFEINAKIPKDLETWVEKNRCKYE